MTPSPLHPHLSRRILLLTFAAWPVAADAQTPAPSAGSAVRQPMLMPNKQSLFQRVITRPGGTISPHPDTQGAKPLPGFSVFYVYARQGGEAGYVEVGRAADGRTEGWVPAAKTIDWKHTMVGAFTNPAPRHRVLFLDTSAAETHLLLEGDPVTSGTALQHSAEAGQPSPVVAVEPAQFADITERFYLLPILSAERVEREFGPPVNVLEVISAPAEPRRQPPPRQDYKSAIVFLIDTTLSMQLYIERTREAIRAIVERISASEMKDSFRYGLVAYRDSLDDTDALEYAFKVYAKPDFTQPPDAIIPAIAQVAEAHASSLGFDEDPIGGLKSTIEDIDWSPVAGRHIVLITDSGARGADHPHSVTGLGVSEIKQLANEKKIAIWVVHLLTPEGARHNDHEKAAAQYKVLSAFNGAAPLYFPVQGGEPAEFRAIAEQLSRALIADAARATGRAEPDLGPAAPTNAAGRIEEQARLVSEAMRLSYVGRQQQTAAPDVVRSFTTDRDLGDPTIEALGVRVLLTRNQLSDLAAALENILRAGRAGRIDPQTFFTQLRSAFAAAATDPQRIAQATNIGGLLGEYLDGLPYQSEVLSIGESDWVAMGAIAQQTVLNSVESKLRLYREFQAQPQLWQDLTHSGLPGEAVYPVPLAALP